MRFVGIVLLSWFAAAGVAHADDAGSADAPAGSAAADAASPAGDQLVLPKGRAVVDAFVEANLSSGAAFKPISVSPDIWYGVNDKLTVGLVHSTWGETGFAGNGIGNSLCLSGSSDGCGHLYNNVALDGRYELKRGDWAWAADGGLDFVSLSSPFAFDIKLGAVGRWHKDKLAVELAPALYLAVTHRSADANTVGDVANHDAIAIPVTALYAVAPKITLAAQVGIILPLEDTGDDYQIPLSIGAHYRVNEKLDVLLAFTFIDLIGGSAASGADLRTLTLGGSYAL